MDGQASGRNATYLIMFSLFLKLLGFFVVLYSYAEFQPNKVAVVERSLQERFNVSLPKIITERSGEHMISPLPVQNAGRAYQQIAADMKTQIDFLSSQINARTNTLILTVPADIVLPLDGHAAKSPDFAGSLVETLKKNSPEGVIYKIQIVGKGEGDALMRSLGDFVQGIIAQDYAPRYVTIGFADSQEVPTVDFIIMAAPR